jgi:hypothetical protein
VTNSKFSLSGSRSQVKFVFIGSAGTQSLRDTSMSCGKFAKLYVVFLGPELRRCGQLMRQIDCERKCHDDDFFF